MEGNKSQRVNRQVKTTKKIKLTITFLVDDALIIRYKCESIPNF